jgi:hypothetical protein
MTGLVPAIHALAQKEGMDARHKVGHDVAEYFARMETPS